MASDAERLAEAINAKSEIEGFLANLEKLKSENAIEDEQYLDTRKDYYRRLGVAASEIARIKNELKARLEVSEKSLELSRKKLSSLDVKRKVGELSADQYQAAEGEIQAEIQKLEKDVEELSSLINASAAADITAPKKPPVVRKQKPAADTRETPPVKAAVPSELTVPAKRPGLSRGKLLAIIGAAAVVVVIAVVAVFLLLPGQEGKEKTIATPEEGLPTVDIMVNAQGAAGIGSLQFELVYDWNLLRAVQVESGALTGNALLEYRIDVPGRVIVGMVDTKGISGDGSVALITFQPRGEIKDNVTLSLENISAHDASAMSQILVKASSGSYSKDGASVPPILIFSDTGE